MGQSSRTWFGEGNGNPLQYSCLENPMDRIAWKAAVRGVTKSQTWLSDFTFTFHFPALEKGMATHSSVLAWRIPGTGEPGGLLSMGLHRVGHDWSDLAAAAAGHDSWRLFNMLNLPWKGTNNTEHKNPPNMKPEILMGVITNDSKKNMQFYINTLDWLKYLV